MNPQALAYMMQNPNADALTSQSAAQAQMFDAQGQSNPNIIPSNGSTNGIFGMISPQMLQGLSSKTAQGTPNAQVNNWWNSTNSMTPDNAAQMTAMQNGMASPGNLSAEDIQNIKLMFAGQ